eukprot:1027861-Amphidinium_carterae.3
MYASGAEVLYVTARVHISPTNDQHHISYAELSTLTKMPTFVALQYGRVLSLFGRLAMVQCRLTFSVLALSAHVPGRWHGLVISALTWLKAVAADFRNAPVPTLHTLDAWADIVRIMGSEYKQVVKIAVKESFKQGPEEATAAGVD